MLQAHSFLWHYLWVAPNVLLLLLALVLWRRGLYKQFPTLFAFTVLSAAAELAVYAADVAPSVTPETFWRVVWASLLIEGTLKFALVGEIFAQVFGSFISLARVGKFLIRGVGVVLVVTAAVAAAYTPKDGLFGIVSGAHLLEQTIYLIEAGLLAFIFVLASYFRLSLVRPLFGIALGLSISACVHLATWAIIANGGWANSTRARLDFVNMATYHVCVLIWFYFLLVPRKVGKQTPAQPIGPSSGSPAGSSHEEELDVWNRELERLVQP
jgi:hypothetical protein